MVDGDNARSENEELLIETYGTLSRPDLADCVRGGRKYHRLKGVFEGCELRVGELIRLRKAFLGEEAGSKAGTFEAWCKEAMERHRDSPEWANVQQIAR